MLESASALGRLESASVSALVSVLATRRNPGT